MHRPVKRKQVVYCLHSSVAVLGLAVVALYPLSSVYAEEMISCLLSPSTIGCTEPLVPAGTTAILRPTFPNPIPACKQVTNACSFDFAVPVAEQPEWTSFLQSAFVNTTGSCAAVSDCPPAQPPTDGVCAPVSDLLNLGRGWTNGETGRWGCASSAPPTNQAWGGTSYGNVISFTNLTTWTCPGTNGGADASCGCREGGGYKLTVRFTNVTLIWCTPPTP